MHSVPPVHGVRTDTIRRAFLTFRATTRCRHSDLGRSRKRAASSASVCKGAQAGSSLFGGGERCRVVSIRVIHYSCHTHEGGIEGDEWFNGSLKAYVPVQQVQAFDEHKAVRRPDDQATGDGVVELTVWLVCAFVLLWEGRSTDEIGQTKLCAPFVDGQGHVPLLDGPQPLQVAEQCRRVQSLGMT